MVIIRVEHSVIVSRMLSWKLDLGNIWIKENMKNIDFAMKVDKELECFLIYMCNKNRNINTN